LLWALPKPTPCNRGLELISNEDPSC